VEPITADEIEDMLMRMMDLQGRVRDGKVGDERNNPRQTSPRSGRRYDNIFQRQSPATTFSFDDDDTKSWSSWGNRFLDSSDLSNDMDL
jgi:hypothetical protein